VANETLLASALFAIAAAAVYAYVGSRVGRRRVSRDAQLASRLFTMWWYGLAATTAVGAAQSVLAWGGALDLPLALTLAQVNLLMVSVALWGLLYYLAYVFTGKSRALWPISAFYVVNYVLLVYFVAVSAPQAVHVGRWSATLEYGNPQGGPLLAAVVLLLLGPQIGSGLAYFTLFFKVREPTQRWRIALVSLSIVAWFGSALAGVGAGLSQHDWWQWTTRGIGLAAALTILMAYVPPLWARRKWGIQPLDDGPQPLPQAAPPAPLPAPAPPPAPREVAREPPGPPPP
jgi:hypothetical protein